MEAGFWGFVSLRLAHVARSSFDVLLIDVWGMKRRYFFIHDAELNCHTTFFVVWAGDSRRDIDALRILSGLCRVSPDYYFKPWSSSVDDFLLKCAGQLHLTFAQLRTAHVSARAAVSSLPTADVKNLSTYL